MSSFVLLVTPCKDLVSQAHLYGEKASIKESINILEYLGVKLMSLAYKLNMDMWMYALICP